jgi:hypothetical protein
MMELMSVFVSLMLAMASTESDNELRGKQRRKSENEQSGAESEPALHLNAQISFITTNAGVINRNVRDLSKRIATQSYVSDPLDTRQLLQTNRNVCCALRPPRSGLAVGDKCDVQ